MTRNTAQYCITFLLLLSPLTLQAVDYNEITEGGRIYDKWWVEMELAKPATTHSAYPEAGKKTGANSWRCKECHGWDYRGKDGAYSKGSHFTGIKGIRAYAGGSEKKVFRILKDNNHRYDKVMLDGALKSVAKFVVHGQIDMTKYIDARSKKANGKASVGKSIYDDSCASCHAKDGRGLNLAHKAGVTDYIGTLSNKNPWEVLHKIRNSHPGATTRSSGMHRKGGMGMHGKGHMNNGMPAMLKALSEQQQADLLSYMQGLPKK